MRDRFEDILRDKLQDYAPQPDPRDWGALEKSLGLDAGLRKRTSLYRYAAAAAVGLILTIGGVYLFQMPPKDRIIPLTEAAVPLGTTPLRPLTLNERKANEALEGVLKLKEAIDRSKEQAREMLALADRPTAETTPGGGTDADDFTDRPIDKPAGKNTVSESPSGGAGFTPQNKNTNRTGTGSNTGSTFRPNPKQTRRMPNSNWGLALFADGMTGASAQRYSDGDISYLSLLDEAAGATPRGTYVQLMSTPELYRIEIPEWRHAIPLTLGFSIRKNLPGNWGIESGIQYTYLSSSAEISSVKYKQQLHYLGIPLALTYTPWRNSDFELYGRVAGAANFNIAGRRKEIGLSGNENVNTVKFNADGIQWSVSANVGIQYRLSPVFGIYFEPGLSHYFENSHLPDSYWKEHPTNFNLKIGVRTTF